MGANKPEIIDRAFGLLFFGAGIYILYYITVETKPADSFILAVWVGLIIACFVLAGIIFTGRDFPDISLFKS